jgi:transcriptional regulator with XRE-family HTH domain
VPAPREQLANALRQARKDAGYKSHAALAQVLKVSRPVVSKAESPAQAVPSRTVLRGWADVTGAPLDMLMELAHRAGTASSRWFVKWVHLEARATLIRWFEPLLVPGLIQTENYARSVLTWKPDSPKADVNLHDRMARQSLLDRAELRVVILASVLYREVGDAAVMAEQIDHLLAMGERASVMLQVVPDTPQVAGALGGAFAIATEGATDIAAYAESNIQGTVHTEAHLVTRALRVFDGLRVDALPWSMTQDQLRKAREKWT